LPSSYPNAKASLNSPTTACQPQNNDISLDRQNKAKKELRIENNKLLKLNHGTAL